MYPSDYMAAIETETRSHMIAVKILVGFQPEPWKHLKETMIHSDLMAHQALRATALALALSITYPLLQLVMLIRLAEIYCWRYIGRRAHYEQVRFGAARKHPARRLTPT